MKDVIKLETREQIKEMAAERAARFSNELESLGYIKNQEELIKLIQLYDEPGSKADKLKSELFGMLAQSQKERYGEDSLYKAWLRKASELDPDNQRVNGLLAESNLEKFRDLAEPLVFPIIRETDNRTAKKKIADEYIKKCEIFLGKLDTAVRDLEVGIGRAQKLGNEPLVSKYQDLANMANEISLELSGLHAASKEYGESITGVFYTSTHFFDMQVHISRLGSLRSDWNEIFSENLDVQSEQDAGPLDELQNMIGLSSVKRRVNDYYHFLQYQQRRKEMGFRSKDGQSMNMVLTGNPGTGKTTLARLFARIYNSLGVLPQEKVYEVDRSQLIGAYVGQTEENVKAAVERAIGGVLFIDEAYSLKRDGQSGNDYGQTAIDTLVSLITSEKYSGKFAVILAGYPDEMRQFLNANPGLRSRFPQANHIHLVDFSTEELLLIAEKTARENDYFLTSEARIELGKRIEKEKVDETFGNARTVKDIITEAIFKKGSKQGLDEDIFQYTLLSKDDFEVQENDASVSALSQLNQLIGLSEIKEEVQTLASFAEVQSLRRKRSLPGVPIQLHAVFTGNPGTGKTTVAKIYSRLLKERGMLKRGHLIVTSRADFVAGYVGQTAIKTKKKIREALGGVLFIDEAYSLLSHTEGDFGKEVIDTLVDEMTKHNENLVVILAGYPEEMKSLLLSNPGLRSRFKKFFNFKDYTAEELISIMESYAGNYHYELADDAKLLLLENLRRKPVKGNGRFAANLIDESIQLQSSRLFREPELMEEQNNLSLLKKEDIKAAFKKAESGD
ncbi:AAA family ATPase [Peribacillus sp. B-H-3]|uniref:AAA family ATPase n=1 Tax=Peribacillus sp. B-H-3 TaxID=3400420 RepID=UPI003B026AF8